MIEVQVRKQFGAVPVAFEINVDFQIESGVTVALTGPTGAGKTTILRMIAGLTRPDSGYICKDGDVWFDWREHRWLSSQHRKVGFVFQDYALFPNMKVRQQIAFSQPKMAKISIPEWLREFDLTDLQHHYPAELSGGQKQRVAVARAFSYEPTLLLLDEPLSAQDAEQRLALQDTLLHMVEWNDIGLILVSHNTEEIARLTQQVIRLEAGKIAFKGVSEKPRAVQQVKPLDTIKNRTNNVQISYRTPQVPA